MKSLSLALTLTLILALVVAVFTGCGKTDTDVTTTADDGHTILVEGITAEEAVEQYCSGKWSGEEPLNTGDYCYIIDGSTGELERFSDRDTSHTKFGIYPDLPSFWAADKTLKLDNGSISTNGDHTTIIYAIRGEVINEVDVGFEFDREIEFYEIDSTKADEYVLIREGQFAVVMNAANDQILHKWDDVSDVYSDEGGLELATFDGENYLLARHGWPVELASHYRQFPSEGDLDTRGLPDNLDVLPSGKTISAGGNNDYWYVYANKDGMTYTVAYRNFANNETEVMSTKVLVAEGVGENSIYCLESDGNTHVYDLVEGNATTFYGVPVRNLVTIGDKVYAVTDEEYANIPPTHGWATLYR